MMSVMMMLKRIMEKMKMTMMAMMMMMVTMMMMMMMMMMKALCTVWGCSWHTCGDFLATASMDNTAKIWDLNR